MLSDRIRKWLKARLERALGEYEEGQDPPARLRDEVVSFANEHPKATRGEWIDFAARFAGECYEAGYIRGIEWVERDPAAFETPTGMSPEELADQFDAAWRDRPIVLEGSANDAVPERRTDDDVVMDQVAKIMAKPRRF